MPDGPLTTDPKSCLRTNVPLFLWFESLETNQTRFSQPLDDRIDQVIDLHIMADQPSSPGGKIRLQLKQFGNCGPCLALSPHLAESGSSHHRVPEQFRTIELQGFGKTIFVPFSYSEELYDLRLHIEILRNKLIKAREKQETM